MWDNFEALAETFEADDVIQIRGRVKLYNGQKELTLEQIVPAAARDYELARFSAAHEVRRREALCRARRGRRGREESLDQAAAGKRGRRSGDRAETEARARGDDHASRVCGRIARAHREPDRLWGAPWWRIIRSWTRMCCWRALCCTTSAKLTSSATSARRITPPRGACSATSRSGRCLVREKIKAIPGFPAPLAILVEHLILSHHGTYEFGSPSLPQTREAIALHFLDDMDSKMAAMRATLEGASRQRRVDRAQSGAASGALAH